MIEIPHYLYVKFVIHIHETKFGKVTRLLSNCPKLNFNLKIPISHVK